MISGVAGPASQHMSLARTGSGPAVAKAEPAKSVENNRPAPGDLKVSIKMTVSKGPDASATHSVRQSQETAQAALDDARASALANDIARSSNAKLAQIGYASGLNATG
ncbi:hypothetical protein [Epibacterium ulvae]|uniref:hypothetical protein n=1 Tax=Epibacterium ulvae TaxID=1156985 RepID=UPI00248FBCD3|nr:hypothetical protein [Epibacterium ulvae]